METRANYALIGLFTLAVITAGFLFVYWFSGSQGAGRRDTYRVAFSGSVSGLGVGSLVLFNGLRVGEVKSVQLSPADPKQVIATIDVDRMTPVNVDTKARLEVQILSGVAAVSLIGGRPDSPRLGPNPDKPPLIVAERSDFQDIVESARQVARDVSKLIEDNRESISDAVKNIDKFSKALGDNAGQVDKFLANVGDAATEVKKLAADADKVVQDIDKQKVSRIVDNVDRFTGALGTASPDVEKSVKNIAGLTAKLDRAADQIEGVLKAAQGFLSSPDGKGAFQSIGEAARSVKTLADNLDKRTAEITVGITRFTGAGLREVEALASDGRRTLTDINRTLRSVDRNPQQFIFGAKPPIPEYNGRR